MKKQLLLFVGILCSFGLDAQTYLPTKDFQDQSLTSGGWQNFVVTSTPGSYDWGTQDLGSPTNFYAFASGWNGSGGDNTELWYVSPSFDLSTASSPELNFRNATNFTGLGLSVFISTDYDGTSDPSTQGNWNDITGLCNWSSGNFGWVDGGAVSLTSYNGLSSVYVAYVYTSNPTDGAATWELDDISVTEPVAPTSLTVYDVQYTTDPGGASPYNGTTAIINGTVVAESSGAFNPNDRGYWIQDGSGPWHGIFVSDTVNTVNRGDSVAVTAQVNENFSQTILRNVSNLTIIASGVTEPAAANISSDDVNTEEYEGVLVTVDNATCINPAIGFGQWSINNATTDALVDDVMFSYQTPVQNEIYRVTGVVYYTYSEYKVLPRDANDVTMLSGIEEQEQTKLNIYPNPSSGTVHVDNNGAVINVFSATGQLIQTTTESVLNLNNGVYIIKTGNAVARVIVL